MHLQDIENFLDALDVGRKSRAELAAQVAEICKSVRFKHAMNQRVLAQHLQVRQATVSRWEQGETVPGPWELRRLLELAKAEPMKATKLVRKMRGSDDPSYSLRDQFAMAALPAIILNEGIQTAGVAAETAYQVADAMLKQREQS